MNREKYVVNKSNLPEDCIETVIEGGNHGGFGMYGHQDGDGTATITPTEQIQRTAAAILSMMEAQDED